MSKPKEKTDIKTERVSFHLLPEIIQALQKLAEKSGADLSKEIRRAIAGGNGFPVLLGGDASGNSLT